MEKDHRDNQRSQSMPPERPSKDGEYEVVWPSGERVIKITRLAKRLPSLTGKTICELWDNLFQGDNIFRILEKELSEQFPGVKFVGYKEFGSTHGGNEKEVIATLPSLLKEKGCDAVISAVGC